MGKCSKCGECCRWVALMIDKDPEWDDIRWMSFHGIQLAGNVMFVPCKCKYLTEDNLCAIYDKRPQVCKDFPNKDSKHLQPPNCTMVVDER